MLALVFMAGNEKYSIDTAGIMEIIPVVRIETLPGAPDSIRGMINYRGNFVPLFDIGILLGFAGSSLSLSTRIILTETKLNEKSKIIGFWAEKATDIADINPEDDSNFEINLPKSPYLKRISKYENTILRHLELDLFIDEKLRSFIFREAGE